MGSIPTQIQTIRRQINGYKLTQLLVTAEALGIFKALSQGVTSIEDLADTTKVPSDRLSRFLNALVGNGFLSYNEKLYSFAPEYSVLDPTHPASQNAYLRYVAEVRDRWLQLPEALNGTAVGERNFRGITGDNDTATRKFVEAMNANAKPQASFLAEEYEFKGHHSLDIGAGAGTYSIVVGKKFTTSTGVLLELPGVAPITGEFLHHSTVGDRFHVVEGDYNNRLPDGPFDDAFLFAVLHQEPQEKAARLIDKINESLTLGGRLFLTSFFLDDARTTPLFSVMFGIEMIVMNTNGRVYTHTEIEDMLEQTRFSHVERIDNIPGPATLYIATK